MSKVRKIINYKNACVIKTNNRRVAVESYNDNFIISIKNHGEKWNGEKGSASWKYLGRNTVINHIYVTPETLYEIYIAIGKQLKLSHLNEV